MPNRYDELISPELEAEYCYQKAKLARALENANSEEIDILYRLVGREMARVKKPLIIPYIEVTVSAQCTLHCRDCANFMQHYNKPAPMNLEEVKSWCDAFLDAVDHVLTFRVMGGEPLMQKRLPELIAYLVNHPKIQHLQIVSNATLRVPKEILDLFRGKDNCSMFFSNYGSKVAPKYQSIVQECLDNGVNVQTLPEDIKWFDMGDCHKRTHDPVLLAQYFKGCLNNCRHIWQGELHHCPRSAHARYLGMIDVPERDYVPLMKLNTEERRKRIIEFYELPYIIACGHCDNGLPQKKLVPCAIQVERPPKKLTADKMKEAIANLNSDAKAASEAAPAGETPAQASAPEASAAPAAEASNAQAKPAPFRKPLHGTGKSKSKSKSKRK